MLLTITNTKAPATDLGYLLHKNPSRMQTFELSFGKAFVFYPDASLDRCTAALLLDVDPVGLVRTRRGPSGEGGILEQYVNDRPYVASSFMSVAIARVFNSALAGNSKDRPELVSILLPLTARIAALPCRGGEEFLRRLFEPLGYSVSAEHHPLDEKFPEWGESRYYTVEISKNVTLQDLLTHLYVLIPVLDADKHYWVGKDEVEKLLRHGEGWLQSHPEREAIVNRYLRGFRTLTREALARLSEAEKKLAAGGSGRRKTGKTDFQAQGVLYIPEKARFKSLLDLPEGADIGKAINEAMKAIEAENEDLKDVLPKTYNNLEKSLLVSLLKNFSAIPITEGDAFGKIYEYFLGKFAMAEGQKGGEFFTPISIVKLIVEIIEPYHGRIFDPASGSGGMFVQSAAFVAHHKKNVNEISIYGQEKVAETIRLCKMNLAVHGLSGDIRQSNTYYEDPHKSVGKFDFVMANPPFNVDKVDKERIKNDPRYPYELPKADNANYLWIQIFYSALSSTGRAGFVMANSAGDARGSELDIRRELLNSGAVDVMVSVAPNFFYTVALPCTLWFFDKGKVKTERKKKVLFIDARHTFTQIDRAHREFTPQQAEFISNIVRLYRGEKPENECGSADSMKGSFPNVKYADVLGLCKIATVDEIEAQGWSLNPGRYVGVAERESDDFEFAERLEELNEELEVLNAEARELEQRIAENIAAVL